MATFIVDCSYCKAKVAAEISGVAENIGYNEYAAEYFGLKLYVGKCPRCSSLLAGSSEQVGFKGIDSDDDDWTEVERVFPQPVRTFRSIRIPNGVIRSLREGEKSLQAGATSAACVMFGKTLEALARDKLMNPADAKSKRIMLGAGIKELKNRNLIDQRLFDWSQQLQAFRNVAAHADEAVISREDAEDLQAFVYAIIEYIYDLTDRYEEFKDRLERRAKKVVVTPVS